MKIKLNNRLLTISDFIKEKDKVIDIGCDHGLLGIYLVLEKQITRMVSSDINELPLKKAKENILKYGLEKQIELRLGSGLECLSNDLDTIVISGMGGLTINEILQDIKKYDYIKKIIVSPNTDFKETRKVITKLGFNLEKEILVCENQKYYLISCYQKGKGQRINYNYGKLDMSEKIVKDYYSNLYHKNKLIINNLSWKHWLKKINLIVNNFKLLKKIK